MAKRAALQKQSFSALRILAQLFRTGRDRGRFALRRQIGRSTATKGRESEHGEYDHSCFQDWFSLACHPDSAAPRVWTDLLYRCAPLVSRNKIRYFVREFVFHRATFRRG